MRSAPQARMHEHGLEKDRGDSLERGGIPADDARPDVRARNASVCSDPA
jgi:hypothetical protein